ncbi:MAG: monooxygenase, partial [Acidimicrobiaceae bacterium]
MEPPLGEQDRIFPILNQQQQNLEQYMNEACKAHRLIDFRWGNKVLRVDQKSDHAVLEVDTPEGLYTLSSDWVVA